MGFYNKDYKGPKSESTNYLKIEDGKNIFRFMGDVFTYNRYWKGKRPYIYDQELEIPQDADFNMVKVSWQLEPVKRFKKQHIWAVVAIRKQDNGKLDIGILEMPQATLQKTLMNYFEEEDFGDFTKYDLVITRSGSGLETSYGVVAKPPKELVKEEISLYESFEMKDLKAVYDKSKYNNREQLDKAESTVTEVEIEDASVPDQELDIDTLLNDIDEAQKEDKKTDTNV